MPEQLHDCVVAFDRVSKAFYEGGTRRVVFSNYNARFARGRTTAIVGRSGSGKSTLLNLMSGIDVVDSGRVSVLGRDLTGLTDTERTIFRRKSIGFVFQSFNLIPTLTVAENLLLPLELLKVPREEGENRTHELLNRVGLDDRYDSFPDRLSGGERQRVAIARALVHKPELILADEPTGNLDAQSGRSVLSLLSEITVEAKKSLIVVTHSHEVARACDEVLQLETTQATVIDDL